MGNVLKFALAASVLFFLAVPLLQTISLNRSGSEGQPENEPPDQRAGGEQRPEPPVPRMSRAQFLQMRQGMAYADCVQVAGVEGKADTGSHPGPAGVDATYRWLDVDGTSAYVLGFRGGRLTTMGTSSASRINTQTAHVQSSELDRAEALRLEQEALEQGQAIVVSVSEFDRIAPNMTYDECVAIIGAENAMARGYERARQDALAGKASQQFLEERYQWHNPGDYRAEIAFRNGRVSEKKWKKGEGRDTAKGGFGGGR